MFTKNSRSYAGTLLTSDHKLVACNIKLSNRSLFYAKAPKRPKILDTRRLSSDCKQLYQKNFALDLLISNPLMNLTQNKGYYSDVKALVAERHSLHHYLLSSNQAINDTNLWYKMNGLGRMIRKKLKELQIAKADLLAPDM